MKRTWIGVIGLLVAAGAIGCRKQGQAPPVASLSGPLYTWPASSRTVAPGTLIVVRTFQAITAGEPNQLQRIFPVLIARDIPNAAGSALVLGGSPGSIVVLTNSAGGYRLGLHSVVAGGNTYLATTPGQTAIGPHPTEAERGAPLGTLVDFVPVGETAPANAPTVDGGRISVPADTLLFFRIQQPIEFD